MLFDVQMNWYLSSLVTGNDNDYCQIKNAFFKLHILLIFTSV